MHILQLYVFRPYLALRVMLSLEVEIFGSFLIISPTIIAKGQKNKAVYQNNVYPGSQKSKYF